MRPIGLSQSKQLVELTVTVSVPEETGLWPVEGEEGKERGEEGLPMRRGGGPSAKGRSRPSGDFLPIGPTPSSTLEG